MAYPGSYGDYLEAQGIDDEPDARATAPVAIDATPGRARLTDLLRDSKLACRIYNSMDVRFRVELDGFLDAVPVRVSDVEMLPHPAGALMAMYERGLRRAEADRNALVHVGQILDEAASEGSWLEDRLPGFDFAWVCRGPLLPLLNADVEERKGHVLMLRALLVGDTRLFAAED